MSGSASAANGEVPDSNTLRPDLYELLATVNTWKEIGGVAFSNVHRSWLRIEAGGNNFTDVRKAGFVLV